MKRILLSIMAVMAFSVMSVAQDIYTAGYYKPSGVTRTKAAIYKNGSKLYEYGPSIDNFSYEAREVACYNSNVFWVTNAINSEGYFTRGIVMKNNGTPFLDEGDDNDYFMADMAIDHDGNVGVTGHKKSNGLWKAAYWTCTSNGNTSVTPTFLDSHYFFNSYAYGCTWFNNWVYSCGVQFYSETQRGIVWKGPNKELELPFWYTPHAIVVDYEGNIWTAGNYDDGTTTTARVYKNTNLQWILSTSNSRAWDIYMDDALDIYVTGTEAGNLKVWKNGSSVYSISSGNSNSRAVAANTNGVYNAGHVGSAGKIWKNGSTLYSPTNCEIIYGMYIGEPECTNSEVRSLPFYDGFENGNTSWPCWTVLDLDNNNGTNLSFWTRGGTRVSGTPNGDYLAMHMGNPDASQNGWLITPRLFLQPGRDNTTLSFKSWTSSNNNLWIEVYVSTNSDPTSTSSYTRVFEVQQSTSGSWTTYTVDLSDYQGEAVYIGFHYYGSLSDAWLIDEVNVTESWTPCSIQSTPYSYDFNNWEMQNTCWYIWDGDKSGGQKCWKYNSSEQCAYHPYGQSGVAQYGCLVSPNINLASGHDYVLKFKTKTTSSGSGRANKIYIKLDGTGVPNPNNYTTLIWSDSQFSSSWTEIEVPLSSYAGHTISFSFEYSGTYAHNWFLDDVRVEEAIAEYTITANANNSSWGTVSGGGQYPAGATCTLTATPASGYQFDSWKKNGSVVSTSPVYAFTVTENATYTAYFSETPITYYEIQTGVTPAGAGTVSGGGTYPAGSSITLTATANAGYTFSQWQDGNTQNPRTITVTGNATYTASFTQDTYQISTASSPANGGTVTGGGAFHYGDTPTLTATPASGFEFAGWQDGNTDNPRQITVTGNATYTAYFNETGTTYYNVTASVSPAGAGTVSGTGSYEAGSVIVLTAIANPGYTFDHWNDGSTTNPRTVTVNNDLHFTAYFTRNQYTITVNANPSNAGMVSGGGAYYYGDYATLTATAYSGYEFVGWSDGSSENPHQVLVTGNATYTATFSQSGTTYYTVSAYISPAGAGTVTGTGTFPAGATTTLTATANTGYTFSHWNDGSTTNPRTVTVNNNMSFTAYFNTDQYTITVNASPSDGGTVTGGGIYPYGATATLTAMPASGFEFLQWSDGDLQNPRTVTVTGNATYTALFSNGSGDLFTLTVTSAQPILGQVFGGGTYPAGSTVEIRALPATYAHFVKWDDGNTDNPRTVVVNSDMEFVAEFNITQNFTITVESGNPDMGQAFGSGSYQEGAEIQIAGVPFDGYEFLRWDDNNTDNPRTVTVTGNATYTAYFRESAVVTHTITLLCNTDEGSVSGGGVYVEGTQVLIQAFPRDGFAFDKWSDNNTDNPRTVTVNGDITLVAFFKGTGVDENEQNNYVVYPNPAKETIRILGIEANSEIQIYNVLGELVRSVNAGPNEEIGVDNLAEGLYLIRCGNVTLRFVKER